MAIRTQCGVTGVMTTSCRHATRLSQSNFLCRCALTSTVCAQGTIVLNGILSVGNSWVCLHCADGISRPERKSMLVPMSFHLRKEALQALKKIGAFEDLQGCYFDELLHCLTDSDTDVQREAIWIIQNLTT